MKKSMLYYSHKGGTGQWNKKLGPEAKAGVVKKIMKSFESEINVVRRKESRQNLRWRNEKRTWFGASCKEMLLRKVRNSPWIARRSACTMGSLREKRRRFCVRIDPMACVGVDNRKRGLRKMLDIKSEQKWPLTVGLQPWLRVISLWYRLSIFKFGSSPRRKEGAADP